MDRRQRIDFPAQRIRVTVPPIRMKHDRLRRRELTRILPPLVETINFAQLFATTMKPDIEPPSHRSGCERFGDHETIRLNTAVDFGNVSARHGARLNRPRSLTRHQLSGSSQAVIEQRLGDIDFLQVEELTIHHRVGNRRVVDQHIRQQFTRSRVLALSQAVDPLLQFFEALFQLPLLLNGDHHSERRDWTDRFGLIIGWAVGQARRESGLIDTDLPPKSIR